MNFPKKVTGRINSVIIGSMLVVAFLFGVFFAATIDRPKEIVASDGSSAKLVPMSFADIADAVSPTVVNIRTEKVVKEESSPLGRFGHPPFGGGQEDPFNDFFDRFFGDGMPREYKERSLGSGFIIDSKGLIVTNNHVIENADTIKVRLKDGKEHLAEIVGRDPKTDIALIRAKDLGTVVPTKFGNSDALRVGEWVVAVGSPFGLEHTVTAGIVSAKGRVIGSGPYDDFIQTDASINPGNSGGPLVNLNGEVVGINTAIFSRSGGNVGIGFAIPISMARKIIDQLIAEGSVTRGWLGVSIQDLNPELAQYYGVKDGRGALIGEVFDGDPAAEAGIKPKDVVIEINGKAVQDSRDLSRMIADVPVGQKASVKLVRNGKERTVEVKIAKRTDDKETHAKKGVQGQTEQAGLGMTLAPLTPELARRLGMPDEQGLVVVKVEKESPAAKAEVSEGDLILEINHTQIKTLDDCRAALSKVEKGQDIFLLVRRAGGLTALTITK